MSVVTKLDVCQFQHSLALDVDLLVGVDQDVGDRRIGQKRLQRAEAENLVEHFLRQPLPFLQVHRRRFAGENRFEYRADLAANILPLDFVQAVEVEFLDKLAMNRSLHVAEIRSCAWHATGGHLCHLSGK